MSALVLGLLLFAVAGEDGGGSVGPAGLAPDLLVRRGIDLRRVARDDEALALFREAYRSEPSARIRAQIGLAEQALARWLEAERDLKAALSDPDPWVDKNRAVLEGALEAIDSHLASLRVDTNVLGAGLWLDGVRTATLPSAAPFRVLAGEVLLEARATGFGSTRRTIVLQGGDIRHELLLLIPRSTTEAGSAAVAPTRSTSLLGWLALGGAGLAFASAGVAQAVREGDVASYNDDTRCFFGDQTRDQRCGSLRSAANTAQIVAIAGLALGAAAAAVGVSAFVF
jgi:hypothetical protein